MTRVDFYLLDESTPQARELLVCRLAEKAYKLGHRVYIHVESPQQGQHLDDLLWTFRPGSFIPHALGSAATPLAAVVIGQDGAPDGINDVLINLSPDVPAYFSRFLRVAEIVDGTETARQSARQRYRYFRERGYALATHEVSGGT